MVILAAVIIGIAGAAGNTQAVSPSSAGLIILVPAVFLAGILSFLSPCTLPILPAYFAFSFQARRSNVVIMTVAFFLGLATTLTVLGASATALGSFFLQNLDQITVIGGLLIVGFGVLSLSGRGFAGPQVQERVSATLGGSYFYGATFALGWTACLGPILGAVLTLLASQGLDIVQGTVLAFVYALGLGSPLIVISVFFSRLGSGSAFWRIIRGRGWRLDAFGRSWTLHSTSLISGSLSISLGILLASGQLTELTQEWAGSGLSLWVIESEEWIRQLFGLQ